jgi:hypothetical protein
MRAALLLMAAASAGCASTAAQGVAPRSADDDARANVAPFVALEANAIDVLAAVDPRVARRFHAQASAGVLEEIGTAAVLAEDASATVRGGALDLFAFKARGATLALLATKLAKSNATLPEIAPAGGAVAHPRLERELLLREVESERARILEESPLGDASAPLVRAMVELWSPGATAAEWRDTDAWVTSHLLQIRDSYESPPPRTAASDLEPALFELEKLLVPMQFGKSAFALTQLHAALDKDSRPHLPAMNADVLAARARVHLGVAVTAALPGEIAAAADAIQAALETALAGANGEARDAVEKEARSLLFADAKCTPVVGSRARSAAPPPERSGICNALTLAQRTESRAAALMALHDEVVIAGWALTPPSPRAHLATMSFRVDDDLADTMKEMAAARPLTPLAVGVMAAFVYRAPADAMRVAAAWQALGDLPIDLAERELSGATPPPTFPHP